MKTTKRTAVKQSAAERLALLDAEFDALIESGADSKELQRVNDALEAARAEATAEAKIADAREVQRIRVQKATARAEQNKRAQAGLTAAKQAPLPVFKIEIDGVTIAEIRVVPLLSMPEIFDPSDHPTARQSVSVVFQAASNFAAAVKLLSYNLIASRTCSSDGGAPYFVAHAPR